jgi:hypothetical protein
MKPHRKILAFALLFAIAGASFGQAPQVQLSAKPNAQIERILKEISATNIEANIRKLVSFGTRHTLSTPDDPNRGIGAARKWIKEEFDRYSKESGGRLIVSEDDFIQPAGGRVAQLTRLINIVGTLPGKQAESKDRIYVVSGHYDSICSPNADVTCDAPGANDDASGTAAVMEMARVMSQYEFDDHCFYDRAGGRTRVAWCCALGRGSKKEVAKYCCNVHERYNREHKRGQRRER